PRHGGARVPGGRAVRTQRTSLPGSTVHGPAIVFDEVGLTLGRTAILRGVSFMVSAGSVHALVGPNGAGKSSLVKTLLGQMPHRGRLALDWPQGAQTVGYVP